MNYGRKLATVCLHFGCLPEALDPEALNDYLEGLAKRKDISPSLSGFKHTVYGLRFYYRLIGHSGLMPNLPSIKGDRKLPAVLSREECKELFKAPTLMRHRLMLCLIYSAGLRAGEFCNLKISDIDFDRELIHIRNGKGNKDRYVPLSKLVARGLRNHIESECPKTWLFNGKEYGEPFSTRGLQWVLRESVKKTGISKEDVCVHTLRHSYATHLLEDGVNLVQIQQLLGHENIETTMVYLHISTLRPGSVHSPFDTLYSKKAIG